MTCCIAFVAVSSCRDLAVSRACAATSSSSIWASSTSTSYSVYSAFSEWRHRIGSSRQLPLGVLATSGRKSQQTSHATARLIYTQLQSKKTFVLLSIVKGEPAFKSKFKCYFSDKTSINLTPTFLTACIESHYVSALYRERESCITPCTMVLTSSVILLLRTIHFCLLTVS